MWSALRRRIWPISVETPLRRGYSKLYLNFFFFKAKATVDEERKFYIISTCVIHPRQGKQISGERRADDAHNVGRCYYIIISSLIFYFLRFPSTTKFGKAGWCWKTWENGEIFTVRLFHNSYYNNYQSV